MNTMLHIYLYFQYFDFINIFILFYFILFFYILFLEYSKK